MHWNILLAVLFVAGAETPPADSVPYGVASWPVELGNHRAVVEVDRPAEAILVELPWRRRDLDPDKKAVLVFDAATGKRIANAVAVSVTPARGEIVFQPSAVPGKYYIYYLPLSRPAEESYTQAVYARAQETADEVWRSSAGLTAEAFKKGTWRGLPRGKLVAWEAMDEYDKFTSMERSAARTKSPACSRPIPRPAISCFRRTGSTRSGCGTSFPIAGSMSDCARCSRERRVAASSMRFKSECLPPAGRLRTWPLWPKISGRDPCRGGRFRLPRSAVSTREASTRTAGPFGGRSRSSRARSWPSGSASRCRPMRSPASTKAPSAWARQASRVRGSPYVWKSTRRCWPTPTTASRGATRDSAGWIRRSPGTTSRWPPSRPWWSRAGGSLVWGAIWNWRPAGCPRASAATSPLRSPGS